MFKDAFFTAIKEDLDLQESLDSISEISDDLESLDVIFMDESDEEKIDRLFPSGLNESFQKMIEREE